MTATVDAPAVEAPAKKPPLFGKEEKRTVLDPLWDGNPISIHALGVCSALAVTLKLAPTLIMCGAVVFVLCASNVVVSLLRNYVPHKIRIIVMLTVISSLVTLVDIFLKSFAFDLSKSLSVFIALIVTNCIVMGRADSFAMANPPWRSFLDGLGSALGYSWILITVAIFREVLGSGELLGFRLIPTESYAIEGGWYVNNGLMVLAPGAFLMIGIVIWVQRSLPSKNKEAH